MIGRPPATHRVSRPALAALIIAALGGVWALPAAAQAAPSPGASPLTSSPASATAPSGPAPAMDVQLWPSEAEGALLVVAGMVPEGVDLPYTLRLPLPAGATVSWAGEVLGGQPENDVERPHTEETASGGRVLVMELTKNRVGQYDALYQPPTGQGGRFVSKLDWVQSAPASSVHFAVKFAATALDVQIQPAAVGAPQTNSSGERLYTLPPRSLDLGASFSLTTSFRRGSAPAATPQSMPAIVLPIAIALLAIAILALVLVMARRRGGSPESEEEDQFDAPERSESASDDPFDGA